MNKTLEGFQTIDLSGFNIGSESATVAGIFKYVKQSLQSKKNYILSFDGGTYIVNNADVDIVTSPKETIYIRFGATITNVAATQRLITVNEEDSAVVTEVTLSGGGSGSLEKFVFSPDASFTWDTSLKKWSATLTQEEAELLVEKCFDSNSIVVLTMTIPTSATDESGAEAIITGQSGETIAGIYGESTYITAGDYLIRAIVIPTYSEAEDPEITGGAIDLLPFSLTRAS